MYNKITLEKQYKTIKKTDKRKEKQVTLPVPAVPVFSVRTSVGAFLDFSSVTSAGLIAALDSLAV